MSAATSSAASPPAHLSDLIQRLTAIRDALAASEAELDGKLADIHPTYLKSASNLVHYVALRHRDIRPLQRELAELGLSSLGRAEAHVMATLDAVLTAVHGLAAQPWRDAPRALEFREGNKLLREHTEALLGPAPANRPVRIMVTMPSEAAANYELVRDLVARGMNCMRINCSYDGAEEWIAMATNLKRANRELGRNCRISMDLAGPKVRVGPLAPGPEVIKIRPQRDEVGKVVAAARIRLVPENATAANADAALISVPVVGDLAAPRDGDRLNFVDARGSSRSLIVVAHDAASVEAECLRTAYLVSGTELRDPRSEGILRVGRLPALEQAITLHVGDEIVLSSKVTCGTLAENGENGLQRPATIGCTIPEILDDLKPGEHVWFDDGKIGGMIQGVADGAAVIEITQARQDGTKLRGNKGINLPDSDLKIASLTPKDLRDLEVAAAHADIIGMSFVRTPADVETLAAHLTRLGRPDIGIMLKIETRQAFDNLPNLVLATMRRAAAGVMIARGDLAVECGYERLAEIQEEILWLCEAAHVPVIWATQVLETLAKVGMPSRAEITDAAMGERAECVMLNKGPHLADAVGALDDILRRMQDHQVKKSSMLRELRRW